MSKLPAFERLVQKQFPGQRLLRAWPLQGGISATMTALEIAGAEHAPRRWVVRQPGDVALQNTPNIANNEYRILQVLHAQGVAVPEPYAYDPSGEVLPGPYLLIEFIEGQPDFAPIDAVGLARQMAEELVRIHMVDGSRAELSFLPRLAGLPPIDLRPTGIHEALEAGHIRDLLAAARPLERHNAPTLLHGDYWPGNILWRAGRLAAVIDWEDAALGDPLADLAISRLDLLWIYCREAMETFTHHYQALSSVDMRNLPYWDLSAALRLARMVGANLGEWAAFFHTYGRTDITENTIREHYRFFVNQAIEAFDRW